ncbi:MAG TPA: hypothetical protein PKW49_13965 [Paludibacteraceae bacterium]|nr:hypothetical protein [Paludibacteraceae bacterium]
MNKKKQFTGQNFNPKKQVVTKNDEKVSFWQTLASNQYVQIALLIFVGVIFFINYEANYDKKLDLNGDNIYYYSLAQSLHAGKGYTDIVSFEEKPHTHFPPGYSAFISVGMYSFGDTNYVPVKRMNGLLLSFSILMFFLILRKITKNNVVLVFTTLLLICIHKDLLRWSTIMMSEMLYLFLTTVITYTAMILYEKKSFREFNWKTYSCLPVLLLSVCYVYFVRTMGISMILGVAGFFFAMAVYSFYLYKKKKEDSEMVDGNKKRSFYYLALAGLIVLSFSVGKTAWTIRNNQIGHAKSDYVSDFQKKKNGQKMTSVEDWLVRIKTNTKTYVAKLLPETTIAKFSELETPNTSGDYLVGIIVCLLLIIGFAKTGVGGFLIFSYLAVTFGVLLVWPEQYTSVRYYVATVPFLLFLFLNGIYNVFVFVVDKLRIYYHKKALNPNIISLLVLGLFLVWLMPTHSASQEGYRVYAKQPLKKVFPNVNGINYLEAIDWSKKNIPDTARMFCRKPELYYMYSGYHKAAMFKHYMDVDSVIPYFVNNKATHIIMDSWFKHAFTTILPAVKKYPEKFKILHVVGKIDTVTKENPTYIIEFNNKWGYYGDRVDGKKEGQGYELFQNGKKYVGEFHNNAPNGKGELYDSTGVLQMKGSWSNGRLMIGEGTEYYGDRKYKGSFVNGKPDGFGIIYAADGKELARGIWKQGTLVKSQPK